MNQFDVSYNENGDLWMAGGWLVAPGAGVALRIGEAPIGRGALSSPGRLPADASVQEIYVGGSGRNLVLSGFPGADAPNGLWGHGYWRQWSRSGFRLDLAADGSAAITDGTDVVATLASGGPAGTYVSTAYGEALFETAFSVVVALEEGWPGTVPPLAVSISSGRAQGGKYTAVDAAHWTADADAAWTVYLHGDGTVELLKDGAAMAAKANGTNIEPAGVCKSTEAGLELNPVFAAAGDAAAPGTNPFGVVTIVYSWTGASETRDLDTTTVFLEESVGYPGPYLTDYMTHSGDVTAETGTETVTVDLGAAWEAGLIQGAADILCMADWYPSGASGPATLTVTHSIGGDPLTVTIFPGPGPHTPASTQVLALRIAADGSMTQEYGPWTAAISRYRVPVRAGTVYVEVTLTAGVPTAVAGPFFATTMPASTSGTARWPIAVSDGAGQVGQLHSGPLVWA